MVKKYSLKHWKQKEKRSKYANKRVKCNKFKVESSAFSFVLVKKKQKLFFSVPELKTSISMCKFEQFNT